LQLNWMMLMQRRCKMRSRALLVAYLACGALLFATSCGGDENGRENPVKDSGGALPADSYSPPPTDSGGAPPADSGGAPPADSYSPPPADSSGAAADSCVAFLDCTDQCTEANWESCEQACLSKASAQAQQLAQALFDCEEAAYEGTCKTDCEGTDENKCYDCLDAACAAQLDACEADQ
jgi:hypothetical protein